MARRDALIRLSKTLMARRTSLRKVLAGELADLRNSQLDTGDSADEAFDAGSDEIATQLVELEARELNQIERAIARIKQGNYGLCEGCQKKIPVARLNALPYSTTCIECQREMENYPGWDGGRGGKDWANISDSGGRIEDEREVNIAEIEMDLSSH